MLGSENQVKQAPEKALVEAWDTLDGEVITTYFEEYDYGEIYGNCSKKVAN